MVSDRRAVPHLLHDELVARLRKLIVEGELRPGEHIDEQRLCERFAVSRTPLREAIKVLAAERLVRLLPKRGAAVARLTDREVDELLRVLAALHALAGELACTRIDDAGIARICAMHGEMVDCARRGDARGYVSSNQAVHRAIFAASGNAVLNEVYLTLDARLKGLTGATDGRWHTPSRAREASEEHAHIIEAMQARNGPLLAQASSEHMRKAALFIRSVLGDLAARDECG